MAGAGTSKNRGGRPPERGESKRSPISMRTTPTIRAALEAAAERQGRSLAQEIEQRLERSIEMDGIRGSRETAQLIEAVAAEIIDVERWSGGRWFEDQMTFYGTLEAVTGAIKDRAPKELVNQAAINRAMAALVGAERERDQLLASLGTLGAAPVTSALAGFMPFASVKTGVFGAPMAGEKDARPSIASLLLPTTDGEDKYDRMARQVTTGEYFHVDGTPYSDDEKQDLAQRVLQLRDLEEAVAAARKEFDEAYAPQRKAMETAAGIVRTNRAMNKLIHEKGQQQ